MKKLLHNSLGVVCTVILASLVSLTVVDILGRYCFNTPVAGAYELTKLMLAALIFSALPLTTFNGEHVEVDILYDMASAFSKRLMQALSSVVAGGALLAVSWRLAIQALKLDHDGAVTEALSLPLAPIAWIGSLAAGFSGLLAILYLVQFSLSEKMIRVRSSDDD